MTNAIIVSCLRATHRQICTEYDVIVNLLESKTTRYFADLGAARVWCFWEGLSWKEVEV